MKPDSEFSLSAIQRKRGQTTSENLVAIKPESVPARSLQPALHQEPAALRTGKELETTEAGGGGFTLPFDPLRLVDIIYRRVWLLILVGLATSGPIVWAGLKYFKTHYVAVAQIIKQAPATALRQSEIGDPYQPHELTIPTLTALMHSAALMDQTSKRLDGKIGESTIKSGLVIAPERNTDIVRVTVSSDTSAEAAVCILKAYIEEVLTLTRDIQQREAAEMNLFFTRQAKIADEELIKINQEMLDYGKREQLVDADKQLDSYLGELAGFNLKYETTRLDHDTLDLKIQSIEKELAKVSPAAAKLQRAHEDLAQLQLRYTSEHPALMEAEDRVKALEAELANDKPSLDAPPKPGESPVGESLYLELIKMRSEKRVLAEQLTGLANIRSGLDGKLKDMPRKALEYARIKMRKQALETSRGLLVARQREAAMQEESSQGSYRLLSMARPQDALIERPTKKLALAGIGGFAASAGGLAFIFALFAALDRRVLTTADLKRITGLPILGALKAGCDESAVEWAFHTWTKLQPCLLMPATGGATVCGLLTTESRDGTRMPALLAGAAISRGLSVILISHQEGLPNSIPMRDAVDHPESILRLLGQSPHEIVHLALDSEWQWTHEQRQHWLRALGLWSQARNTVILVQLSAPAQAQTLLVAERMPNLIWIGQSNRGQATDTETQLRTYRAAGCRIVGALFDQAPAFRLGLLNKFAAVLAFCLLLSTGTSRAESVVLGPGDAVNITAVGYPEYARDAVAVGADGNLTYLQAQDIRAAGLTIDDLRAKLTAELRRYYKNMILVVTPMTFQSRKVYVLGKIVKKGAVNLDRPLTILEVVAEAGGLETGLFQQNTVELADLGHSFLMRGRQRMPVDMEALFMKGDMTQNLRVESGDYLYFPSANSNEIYVMGNVKMQGTQGLLAQTTVHSAIAQAGGFAQKAYTRRVLVVRGTLDKPETFVVNMEDLLAGRTKGFRLQPKDIVYVADKPWARAEELVQFAVNAFLQGAVSGWAGANVGPFIKQAILPSLK